MNQENPIDELFRRKLGQSEAPVPDDMWSRIAAARQPEQTRPVYGPYWLWGSLAVASLLVLGLWLGLRPSEPAVTIGAFPLEESGESLPAAPATATVDELSVSPGADVLASAVPVIPSTSAVTATVRVTGLPNSQSAGGQLRQPATNRLADVVNPLPAAAVAEETQSLATDNLSLKLMPEMSVLEADDESMSSEDKESGRIFGPHRRRQVEVVDILPTQNFQQGPEDLSRYLLPANHAPRCAKFSSDFLRFDLEILGGPAYAHQQLEAKTSESLDHLKRRLGTEQPALSYGGGIRLSAVSRTGLGLRMGLNYNQINDRFEYSTGSRMDITTNYGPNGEVLSIDTTFVGADMAQVRNKLKMIEIPLLVTYETQWKRLRLGFNVGAALNLWFDASGMLYSPVSEEPIAFGQVGDRDVLPIFESQASAAVLGSLTFAYNLRNRWSVVAEPYVRSHPRAFSNEAYDLKQNYWQTGVQLGVRVRL